MDIEKRDVISFWMETFLFGLILFCRFGEVKLAEEVYQLLVQAFPSPDFDPPLDSLMKDGFGGQYCAQHLGLWQHPFGSARIGAVLDHQLRVRGVEDLYVADASALPDWALAGHPDAGIRAVGSLVAQFAAADVERKKRSFDKFA